MRILIIISNYNEEKEIFENYKWCSIFIKIIKT